MTKGALTMKRRIAKGIITVGAVIALTLVLHYARSLGVSLLQSIGAGGIVTALEDLFDTLDCLDMVILISHIRKHNKKVSDRL